MARWTSQKTRVYGPARDSLDEAERDRLAGQPSQKVEKQPELRKDPPEILVWEFAYKCMKGGYGRSIKGLTFDTNETYRRVHLNPSPLADMRVCDVRPTDIEDWVSGLRSRKTKKVDGKLITTEHIPAPATIRRIYAFVAKIFAIAVRDDLIDRTPCRSIRLPEIKERENRVLSPEESSALMEPQSVIDVALVLGISGFSRSEVLALKWSDIREDEKLIAVPGEKNIHRKRVIPLTDWIQDSLSLLDRSTEYVITNRKGGQFGTHTMLIGEYKTYILMMINAKWCWNEVVLPFEKKS